jgi:hypothetical protein
MDFSHLYGPNFDPEDDSDADDAQSFGNNLHGSWIDFPDEVGGEESGDFLEYSPNSIRRASLVSIPISQLYELVLSSKDPLWGQTRLEKDLNELLHEDDYFIPGNIVEQVEAAVANCSYSNPSSMMYDFILTETQKNIFNYDRA